MLGVCMISEMALYNKDHPLFSDNKQALQLVIYYETANPLGSYRGRHKLGITMQLMKCIHAWCRRQRFVHNIFSA